MANKNEIEKHEKFMHWLWRQKSITAMVLDYGMDGIAKKYVEECEGKKANTGEWQSNIPDVSCRTSVNWFAKQMELKLRENDYKGGWGRCSHSWLLNRLKQEVVELEKALDIVDNQENVIKEAADVANFALMIADIAGELYGN